jgi:hypothetical protein
LAVVPPIAGGADKSSVPPRVRFPDVVTVPDKEIPETVPVPPTDETVPVVGVDQDGTPAANVNTWPLEPAARNVVALEADWYGTELTAPPAMFVAAVAVVAVAALPPIDKLAAVPVKLVAGPLKLLVAVMVVPVTAAAVVAPTVVPLIVPPVIATLLAFWVDIVPRPETAVFAIAMAVLVTDVT